MQSTFCQDREYIFWLPCHMHQHSMNTLPVVVITVFLIHLLFQTNFNSNNYQHAAPIIMVYFSFLFFFVINKQVVDPPQSHALNHVMYCTYPDQEQQARTRHDELECVVFYLFAIWHKFDEISTNIQWRASTLFTILWM